VFLALQRAATATAISVAAADTRSCAIWKISPWPKHLLDLLDEVGAGTAGLGFDGGDHGFRTPPRPGCGKVRRRPASGGPRHAHGLEFGQAEKPLKLLDIPLFVQDLLFEQELQGFILPLDESWSLE